MRRNPLKGVTVNKANLQLIVSNLVVRLGDRDKLNGLIASLCDYADSLDNAGQLSEEQSAELTVAQEFVAEQRASLVDTGIISPDVFDAMSPIAGGGLLPDALATIAALTGGEEMQRQSVMIASIPAILTDGLQDVSLPLTVSATGASLGFAKRTRGGNGNADRPSAKVIKVGLANSIYWRHAKIWYQIVNTPDGLRVFNLVTREELTQAGDRPATSSAAQKLVTGGWGAAFRGYISILPDDATVAPLEASELS